MVIKDIDLRPYAVYKDMPLTTEEIWKALNDTNAQRAHYTRLKNYYIGKHDILLREYSDPTKPNNRNILNYCSQITNFYTAYIVGEPVTYEKIDAATATVFEETDEPTQTFQTAQNLCNFGMAAEIFYMKNGKRRFKAVEPSEIIPVLSTDIEHELLGFIRLYTVGEYGFVDYYTATQTQHHLLETGNLTLQKTGLHGFTQPPIAFYKNDNGVYEQLLGIQNAINSLCSDIVNDFEVITDSLLIIPGHLNTDPEEIQRMKQNRVLLTGGDTKPYWLEKTADRSFGQGILDRFIHVIKEKSGLPDMERLGSFGASGRSLQFKLIVTDIIATSLERALAKGIKQRFEVLEVAAPEIIFTRNFIIEEQPEGDSA
jgi:SPP1 family phage portal protein